MLRFLLSFYSPESLKHHGDQFRPNVDHPRTAIRSIPRHRSRPAGLARRGPRDALLRASGHNRFLRSRGSCVAVAGLGTPHRPSPTPAPNLPIGRGSPAGANSRRPAPTGLAQSGWRITGAWGCQGGCRGDPEYPGRRFAPPSAAPNGTGRDAEGWRGRCWKSRPRPAGTSIPAGIGPPPALLQRPRGTRQMPGTRLCARPGRSGTRPKAGIARSDPRLPPAAGPPARRQHAALLPSRRLPIGPRRWPEVPRQHGSGRCTKPGRSLVFSSHSRMKTGAR
jgi:hypothetical protein